MTAIAVFTECVQAIRANMLIRRVSTTDKEFHFQNWFKARLDRLGKQFEIGGRNGYPDFRMVATTDGYELKGLAYPGRDASFDSNSQIPSVYHNGRTIYYIFGRYPIVIGYSFDLQTNDLAPERIPNPGVGREHIFVAWRLKGSSLGPVSVRSGPIEVDLAEGGEAEG